MESYTGTDSTAAAADYAVARIYHWQHEDGGLCSGDLESYEEPLRNRVFFHPYQQSRGLSRLPQFAGAVVEEPTTGADYQYVRYSYNALGLMTRRLVHAAPGGLQPSFRQTDFVYDPNNLIDLLRVTQRNGASDELLLNVVYATGHPHLPGTITDAAGKNWNFTYTSSKHQLETITNPKSEITTFSYDANGYLTNIVGAQVGAATKLSYDGFGRVRTVTDSEGYAITYDYDSLDRLTRVTYPDITYDFANNRPLHIRTYRDRQGRITTYTHDALGRLSSITDPLNRVTDLGWCTCGGLETLTTYKDGTPSNPRINPQLTKWERDLLGRVTAKIYPDGPLSNDTIDYAYDELGRVLTREINGTGRVTISYDNLGRLGTVNNPLGLFTYSYLNQTPRVQSITSPSNVLNTSFQYFPNAQDQRLQAIVNTRAGGIALSRFDHTYDADGIMRSWTQQADSGTATVFELGYDLADQLRWAIGVTGSTATKTYSYTYDTAGNRRTEQVSDGSSQTVQTSNYNLNNQLTTRSTGGSMLFEGRLDQSATVTVGGNAATVRGDLTFVGEKTVSSGANTVSIVASTSSGARTNSFQVTVGGSAATYAFDANGNLTSDGTRTFEYDGADRLVAVKSGALRTEFIYDGFGRRVRIIEKSNGVVQSDKRYVWVESELSEERDSTGTTVLKRYYAQGVQVGTANYFYGQDHVGSIREVVDSAGTTVARYDYDPYGRRTKLSGTFNADFGYIGFYFHPGSSVSSAASGLELALYRAYDPNLGRWLNRDPIGEEGGVNLYGFVGNSPLNRVDPLGLEGNPVMGLGGSWNSDPYGPGGLFYDPGYLYTPPPPQPLSPAKCLVTGAVVGAVGAAAVVVAAPVAVSGLVAAGVSATTASAAVTGTIGVAGAIGGGFAVASTANSALNGNWNAVAFNVGALTGGGLVGIGGGGRFMANNMGAGPSSIPVGANPFVAEAGMGFNRNFGNVTTWLATAPTPASGGAAAAGTAGGAGLLLRPRQ